jgi:uncharacterized membrane protein YbhN (UPF0104 family)
MSDAAKKSKLFLWTVAVIALIALLWWVHAKVAFDWHTLALQLHAVSWKYALAAIALIYLSFVGRGVRWAILLGPHGKGKTAALIAPQFIGFSGVALVGRLADLARPYLIARKLKSPVASQLAVYSIERAFDLCAAAIIFSVTLAFAPKNMPHHAAFAKAGIVSFVATAGIAVFAIMLRVAGDTVARIVRSMLAPLSKDFAGKVADRILDFRDGLRTVSSAKTLIGSLIVSLAIWLCIAECYVLTAHAFVAEPTLATISFTAMMLVMATSMGGSLLQLPILGWFTQIALIAAAFHAFFGVPVETATACSALLLIDNTLCIVPAGLVAAQLSGTSLREAARATENAEAAALRE